jgi:hypothetical protein
MAVLTTNVEYLEYDFTRLLFRTAASFAGTGAATNRISATAHGLSNVDEVSLTGITTLTNVSANTIYYVVGTAANNFQIALTPGGSAIVIGDTGSATVHYYADFESSYPNQATVETSTKDFEWNGGGQTVTLSTLDGLTLNIDLAAVPSYIHSNLFDKDAVTVSGYENLIGFGGGDDKSGVTIGLWIERSAKKIVNGSETGVVTRLYYYPAGTLTMRATPGVQSGEVGSLWGYSFSATPGNADVNGATIPGMDVDDFFVHGNSA